MGQSLNKTANRRDFLKAAAAAAAGFTIAPRHVRGGPGQTPPGGKLHIAGIGVGGMGAANLANMETEEIVALCDVDEAYAAPTFKKYPAAKVYKDFRVMLDKQKDIDAVVIATPDHTHAVITVAAMRAGFCSAERRGRSWPAYTATVRRFYRIRG
jgi:hypothetical protein